MFLELLYLSNKNSNAFYLTKIRRKKSIFISLCLLGASLLSGPILFAQSPEELQAEAKQKLEKLEENKEMESLPTWLLESPFRLSLRIVLKMDGSEAAGGILRKSETWNRIVFQDLQHWRARKELPFNYSALEILQLKQSSFVMTPTNHRVSYEKTMDNRYWIDLVLYPFQITKSWGLFKKADNWNDWFKTLSKLAEPQRDMDNDQLKATYTKNGKTQQLQVVLDGSFLHEGKTKVNLRAEWNLKSGIPVTADDLNKSLLIGGSS